MLSEKLDLLRRITKNLMDVNVKRLEVLDEILKSDDLAEYRIKDEPDDYMFKVGIMVFHKLVYESVKEFFTQNPDIIVLDVVDDFWNDRINLTCLSKTFRYVEKGKMLPKYMMQVTNAVADEEGNNIAEIEFVEVLQQ